MLPHILLSLTRPLDSGGYFKPTQPPAEVSFTASTPISTLRLFAFNDSRRIPAIIPFGSDPATHSLFSLHFTLEAGPGELRAGSAVCTNQPDPPGCGENRILCHPSPLDEFYKQSITPFPRKHPVRLGTFCPKLRGIHWTRFRDGCCSHTFKVSPQHHACVTLRRPGVTLLCTRTTGC